MRQRKLLSQRHPALYFIAVWLRRIRRFGTWYLDHKHYAKHHSKTSLPFRVKKHKSILLRKLGNVDMRLQKNKIINLKLASSKIDGIIIKPGETFSFCKLVGRPTKRKGYVEGLELSFGKAVEGIGGGICQIANLLNWMVLHSPLTIVEKSQHSFDPFPDEGRILPFGSGAAIFYNYIDYQFTNNTNANFQIKIWLTEHTLEGELLSDKEMAYAYHVFEKHHQFLKQNDSFFRTNEIWKKTIDKTTGNTIKQELITKNFARVVYTPEEYTTLEPD
ncbi:VanW family protein [Riemerella columbina]|uniref:VanW family protein n=1 Tax=Riemerella columbina TaxID=103810 RepID=UPI00036111F0|nr:VanW family protein [Riemerella columbina]